LLLERDHYIGILGTNVGDVVASVSDGRVSYEKLLAFRSNEDTEVESVSTRSLRASRVGVTRSTQRGRHLEKALSRIGANQLAPFQLALRHSDQSWRVSPGSGRVAVNGARVSIPELCAWFASTCQDIDGATEPNDFIKSFAHAIALDDLPASVQPTALQLDVSVLDEMLDDGATLWKAGIEIGDSERDNLRQLIRALWQVRTPQESADEAAKTWRLTVDDEEVGKLVVRSSKISFSSDKLNEVEIQYQDGTAESLSQAFNARDQPLTLTFTDPTYAYTAGQLFRDHRLLASTGSVLEVLSGDLSQNSQIEKRAISGRFSDDSLFGFVVDQASTDDDFLMCDDMGTEWADFIGVSTGAHRITFYHCKGGNVDVGASGLHEIISQATKNLGFLTASQAELDGRKLRWSGQWNQQGIPRLQRGPRVSDFVAAFTRAAAAPQATRRVAIVTSSLSLTAVRRAFDDLNKGRQKAEVVHVLWLLSGFIDQCRNVGAVPKIVCRP